MDTQGQGVDRITERGVVVDGKEYPVDCLIYAIRIRSRYQLCTTRGYEVFGRDGQALSDKWGQGVRTLHGMHSRGFPNCLIMMNSQSAFTANFPHALNEQARHLSYIIKHGIDHQVRSMEPTEEAEEQWVQTVIGLARGNQKFLEECTPGYYNNEGKPGARQSAQNGPYGAGPVAFFQLMESWRSAGDLAGLEMK